MVSQFRYTLSYGADTRESQPVGSSAPTTRTEKESGEVFYRDKLASPLVFTGMDYAWLLERELDDANRCGDLKLLIDAKGPTGYVPFWRGISSLNRGKWNLDRCHVEMPFDPDDLYRPVLEGYSESFNILDAPAGPVAVSVIELDANFEFSVTGYDNKPHAEHTEGGWTKFITHHYKTSALVNRNRYKTMYFREVRTLPDSNEEGPKGSGWEVVESTGGGTRWARPPQLENFTEFYFKGFKEFRKYEPVLTIKPFNYVAGPGEIVNATRFEGLSNGDVKLIWKFGSSRYSRNRDLLSVVRLGINRLPGGGLILPASDAELSEFLSAPTLYNNDLPNRYRRLQIAAASDVKRPFSSEPATKAEITLKDLFAYLRTLRLFWFIDPTTGKFRIEHEQYFDTRTGNIDLNEARYAESIRGRRVYSYQTEKMPRFEKLEQSTSVTDGYSESKIDYSSACVIRKEGENEESTSSGKFITDIYGLTLSPTDFPDDAYVMMASDDTGKVWDDHNPFTYRKEPNFCLSVFSLQYHLWSHNRPLLAGSINGQPVSFRSTLPKRKQETLKVKRGPLEDRNPLAVFLTNIAADGQLLSADYNLRTCEWSLDIAFGVVVNAEVPQSTSSSSTTTSSTTYPPLEPDLTTSSTSSSSSSSTTTGTGTETSSSTTRNPNDPCQQFGWRIKEDSWECVVDENGLTTGFVRWRLLEEYDLDTGQPTGRVRDNDKCVLPYFPPLYLPGRCQEGDTTSSTSSSSTTTGTDTSSSSSSSTTTGTGTETSSSSTSSSSSSSSSSTSTGTDTSSSSSSTTSSTTQDPNAEFYWRAKADSGYCIDGMSFPYVFDFPLQ